jgi:hypothetical protein
VDGFKDIFKVAVGGPNGKVGWAIRLKASSKERFSGKSLKKRVSGGSHRIAFGSEQRSQQGNRYQQGSLGTETVGLTTATMGMNLSEKVLASGRLEMNTKRLLNSVKKMRPVSSYRL